MFTNTLFAAAGSAELRPPRGRKRVSSAGKNANRFFLSCLTPPDYSIIAINNHENLGAEIGQGKPIDPANSVNSAKSNSRFCRSRLMPSHRDGVVSADETETGPNGGGKCMRNSRAKYRRKLTAWAMTLCLGGCAAGSHRPNLTASPAREVLPAALARNLFPDEIAGRPDHWDAELPTIAADQHNRPGLEEPPGPAVSSRRTHKRNTLLRQAAGRLPKPASD